MNLIKDRIFDEIFIKHNRLIDHYDLENCPSFEVYYGVYCALHRYIKYLYLWNDKKIVNIRRKLYLDDEKELIILELREQ